MLDNSLEKYTKFIVIFLLFILQVFSSLWSIPGMEGYGLSYFRLLLAAVFFFVFITNGFVKLNKNIKYSLYLCLIIILYMILSLIWTSDVESGLRQISYFATIFMLIYVLDVFIKNESDFILVNKFICFIGIFILIFSIYEIFTGFHLESQILVDVANDASLAYILENQAWATFGNPNDLAAHIAICIFSLLIAFKLNGFLKLSIFLIYAAVSFYIFNSIEARIAMLAIFLFLFLYFILKFETSIRNFIVISSIVIVGSIPIVFVSQLSSIYSNEFDVGGDLSLVVRSRLLISSVDMALSSYLAGVGSGGFENYIMDSGSFQWTHYILNPHNAFGRMLGENGILGLVLFILLVFPSYGLIWKDYDWGTGRRLIVSATSVFPLLLSAGSTPISSSSLQIWIALLWVGARVYGESAMGSIKPEHNKIIIA
jgi:hypothetical protein